MLFRLFEMNLISKLISMFFNYLPMFFMINWIRTRLGNIFQNFLDLIRLFRLVSQKNLNIIELIDIVQRIDHYEQIIQNLSERIEKLEKAIQEKIDNHHPGRPVLTDITTTPDHVIKALSAGPPPPPPPPPPPLPPAEFKFASTPNPVFKATDRFKRQDYDEKYPKNGDGDDDDDDQDDGQDEQQNEFFQNKKQRFAHLFDDWSTTKPPPCAKNHSLIERLLWNFVSGRPHTTKIDHRLFLEDLIQQRKLLRKITRNSLYSLEHHHDHSSILMNPDGKHLNEHSLNEMLKTAFKRKFANINNHSSTLTLDESQFSDKNDFSF